ncbi:tyrosine-type recombinase/integrase [Kitasatospora sp. DSM 101779]|uniref:tyrosine-type recombinase/integrase n=1 Tax=Kitasatospora sp. DSM 101779 TaxID=2853165 RepID=UPI0021D93EC4|nr:site-specific integrase [Kitasatospora sp. DSM 101779]MCU7822847.1 site-specific integrase [Kitasatospora sp. DSM 101779]
MANTKGNRRRFGSVRQLPSGRWQARYRHPVTGQLRSAEQTYPTKTDAELALTLLEADMARGQLKDPDAGQVNFGDYADTWLRERGLADRTLERYEGVLRLYIKPTFGAGTVAAITTAGVRSWRSAMLEAEVGAATVAKSYRVLRAILNTAADEDGLIERNPFRIKGADKEVSAERPVLTIAEVYAIADSIEPRYRALVLMAAFSTLRFGEFAALRRRDVDLDKGIVRVRRAQAELQTGQLKVKRPKSDAGVRPVAFPSSIVAELAEHLRWFGEDGAAGRVFVGPRGGLLRRSNFHSVWTTALADSEVDWSRALGETEADSIRFHDLRHTGNNLAADTGASTRELMHRMGHSTMDAALRYQHMRGERDLLIARGMDSAIKKARGRGRRRVPEPREPDASGT